MNPRIKITEMNTNHTEKSKPSKLEKRDNRGVQSFFRTVYRNHYSLLASIDRKARILITTSSLLLSIIVSLILIAQDNMNIDRLRGLNTLVFVVCCLVSLVYAVLAIHPKKSHGATDLEKIRQGEGSFLYFDNFLKQPLDVYLQEMNRILNNGQLMYDSILVDIYYLGLKIQEKNKYLRRSMYFFFGGLAYMVLALMFRLLLTKISA